jgi:SprT protein
MCNKTLVINRVKECFAIAEARFNTAFRMPNIRFDKRGTTAGTANGGKWELNFNMVLLNENVEHFVKQTVAHEVAHLIDHQVFEMNAPRFDRNGRRKKRAPHGENWKRCMFVLGVPAERCHSMDTSNAAQKRRKSKKFQYKCTGCETVIEMSTIRHNKQQTGKANYSHIGCRGYKLVHIG